ncbi:hypothetical protein G5B40_15425 [Pikeienuella piscinae]|uniref:Uncharacterized protein n=1 Tax=Pikeienuella piscinae TaxID=2748098 RepID=A0A7L5C442_9RHOB|nr:hypothetical protein [Pikeienuella piscinae]QIE56699.1 hypothetical protein G5B40_15425 [Pikeienuella piscinae]
MSGKSAEALLDAPPDAIELNAGGTLDAGWFREARPFRIGTQNYGPA